MRSRSRPSPSTNCRRTGSARESLTQQWGDAFLRASSSPMLRVPSAIVALPNSPDVNVLINHAHPASAEIRIARMAPYCFDPRLL